MPWAGQEAALGLESGRSRAPALWAVIQRPGHEPGLGYF